MPEGSQPSSDAGFEAALGSLVRRAAGNGVDVEGGWTVRNPRDAGVGVELYRVATDD